MDEFCVSLTGIQNEEKLKLKKLIEKLGGRFSSDFTNHVNVLIATKSGTQKYKAAKRLKLPILKPGIDDSRDWLYHIETIPKQKVKQSMDQFRLLPLAGMIISTTGFSGSELSKIRDLIGQMDGIYKPDMTQSTNVLIAKDITGLSPKLDAARNWKIQIEGQGYLQDLLNEFQDTKEQEAAYFDSASIYIGDGFHESLVEYLRKIVRMGGGTFMTYFDACVTHYVTAGNAPLPKDLEILGEYKYTVKIVSSKWLSDCFIEKRLVDVDSYCWDPDSEKVESKIVKDDIEDDNLLKVRKTTKFFSNHNFIVDGFTEEETRILKSNIIQYGGTLAQKNAILIRPFKLAFHTTQKCTTEFWVEKCIQESKFLDFSSSVLFLPTKIPLPIPECKSLIIGLTGFLEVERIWIGRIVNCLGGVCTDTFSRKNTHLLAQDVLAKSAKISKAKEWKCPIIRVDWLYSVLEHGVLPGSSKRVPLQDRISQDDSMVPSLKAGKGEDVFDTISTKVADPYLDPLEQLLFDEVKPVVMPVPEMKPKVMDISEFIPQAEPKKRTIQVEVEKSKSVNTLQQSVSYDDHDSVSQQNRLFQPNTKKPKVIERVFMFSGLSPIDRQTVAREVPNLGGSCLNQDKWDPKCTHLIVLEPQKTEKFLAACASGAWILNMQYIKDSIKKGSFVDEEKYLEIGEFTSVAKHWCRYYQSTGKKAFDGWTVELNVSVNKEPGFKRLLSAGNGMIGPGGFTLIEKQKYKQLANKDDIDYVDSTFLIEYLVSLGKKKQSDYVM